MFDFQTQHNEHTGRTTAILFLPDGLKYEVNFLPDGYQYTRPFESALPAYGLPAIESSTELKLNQWGLRDVRYLITGALVTEMDQAYIKRRG